MVFPNIYTTLVNPLNKTKYSHKKTDTDYEKAVHKTKAIHHLSPQEKMFHPRELGKGQAKIKRPFLNPRDWRIFKI